MNWDDYLKTKPPLGCRRRLDPCWRLVRPSPKPRAKSRILSDEQVRSTGANYFVCDVAFGDLTAGESMQTIKLFGEEVIPHLQTSQIVR